MKNLILYIQNFLAVNLKKIVKQFFCKVILGLKVFLKMDPKVYLVFLLKKGGQHMD